jgi:hypothetical protein
LIDDEPERAELIFLPFAITLPQFAPFTAENDARNTVPTFTPIELCKRAPTYVFVVDEAQRIQGFVGRCARWDAAQGWAEGG